MIDAKRRSRTGGERPEQRAHPRRDIELPVLVHDAGNLVRGAIRFDTRDLSLGGAFLRSDLLFELGEELELEFQLPLPQAPSPGGEIVRARGKVVRVVRDREAGDPGMGIAFFGLSDRDSEAIRAFLARD